MRTFRQATAIAILSACFLTAAGAASGQAPTYGQGPTDAYPTPATVVQVLKNFDNPEGAVFSADGRFVFVSNAAEIGDKADALAWTEGQGYVSKLEVQPSGELRMVQEKLVTGLTAPLGMGVLPVATGKFPAGTIFVCAGSAPLRDAGGQVLTDPERLQTQLVAFDPDGKVLGSIKTGAGSTFEKLNGSPIMLINALGFDEQGNLYVADTAFGGDQFQPPFQGKGGLWMIPVGALDDLADGAEPAEKPSFLAIPGNPDGVEVSPKDGKVYVNTVGPVAGAPDPANGGIYALSSVKEPLPEPVDRNLGALDGLDFTADGTMLNTQIKTDVAASIYVNCPGKRAKTLRIEGDAASTRLTGPADLAARRIGDGRHLVVVPELSARDATPGDDEITVLMLPADFDAACSR